jgi:hypothetical protein
MAQRELERGRRQGHAERPAFRLQRLGLGEPIPDGLWRSLEDEGLIAAP